jgi:hypothetical protein
MAHSIVLGFVAIRRRETVLGPPTEFSRALLMRTGWAINLGVAERIIRQRQTMTCSS